MRERKLEDLGVSALLDLLTNVTPGINFQEWLSRLFSDMYQLADHLELSMTLDKWPGLSHPPEAGQPIAPTSILENGRVYFVSERFNVSVAWTGQIVTYSVARPAKGVDRKGRAVPSPTEARSLVDQGTVMVREDPRVIAIQIMVCGVGKALKTKGSTIFCDSCPQQLKCLGEKYD